LSPAATAAELGLAASALEDTSAGPFFAPERLTEAVNVIRRIRRDYPPTREIAVIPPDASELSPYATVQFRLSDSLFGTLCDSSVVGSARFFDRWLEPARTGLAVFDSITDTMGGSEAINVQGMSPGLCLVTVYYRQPVNVPGVVRAYAGLGPAIAISPFQDKQIGDGDRVRIEAGDAFWKVYMSAGWGDCMVGCVNRHFWEFRYHPATGKLEAVADSGPPVPAWREWH